MTDLQLLFAILAALYVWECACWVRRGSVAFRTWLGRRWKLRHPGLLLGNQRGGFVFAAPLPPLGTVFTAAQLPFSLSPEALLTFVPSSVNPTGRPPQAGQSLKWSEARKFEAVGKKVLANGAEVVRAGSPELARFLAEELEKIRGTSPRAREQALEKLLRRTLDARLIRERLELFQQKARWIERLGNTLFLYLFGLAPALLWRFSLSAIWPGLVAALLACTVALAILFRRAHRELYPEAEDERFTHFLIVLLSPVTAVRTADLLSRPLLESFHPLVVARVLCSEEQFRPYAAFFMRELRYPALPLCPAADQGAQETEQYWRGKMSAEVERFLKREGLQAEALWRRPEPNDAACVAYCPRCESQYTSVEGECEDCGGLKLVPFATPQPEHK